MVPNSTKPGTLQNLNQSHTLRYREQSEHLTHICDRFHSRSTGPIEIQYGSQLRISLDAYREQPSTTNINIPPLQQLEANFDSQNTRLSRTFNDIRTSLAWKSKAEELLHTTGLWPRISPKALLRKLSLQEREGTPDIWLETFRHLAEEMVLVQQGQRLVRFATFDHHLDYTNEILRSRDRSSRGDMDWLLFEIDSNRSIRSNQVEIAQSMIQPKTAENSVMQLNMGEGKSSVSLTHHGLIQLLTVNKGDRTDCRTNSGERLPTCPCNRPQSSSKTTALFPASTNIGPFQP
jgi:hypothetical protein